MDKKAVILMLQPDIRFMLFEGRRSRKMNEFASLQMLMTHELSSKEYCTWVTFANTHADDNVSAKKN